jgi:ADP-ribosylglycohydrolase
MTTTHPSKEELLGKIHGCLAGVACGDAMGMPTSMMSPESIRASFPQGITRFEPAPPHHPIHGGMVAGQVTDDTLQTLVVARSIIEDGKVDPHRIAQRLLAWAESLNGFSTQLLGPSSLRALQGVKAGRSINETGMFGDTNGASMRIAPVGIIHRGNTDATVRDVAQACLATHNTDIAIGGASAVACAIGTCLQGERSLEAVVQSALHAAAKGMQYGNKWIGASIVRRTEVALGIVRSRLPREQILRELYDYIGAGVATTETVPTCLALFVYGHGDPLTVVTLAANLGGDADTIGAIAGGIAGAYAGIDAFPPDVLRQLEDVNHFDLASVAQQLSDFSCNEE